MSYYTQQDQVEAEQAFERLHQDRRLMKAKAVWSNKAEEISSSFQAQQVQTFAGENIHKTYVFSETMTLSEGQRLAVWDLEGRLKVHDGPKSVKIWRSFYTFLTNYVASEQQYLCIVGRDGKRKHVRGPTSQWLDPVNDQSISTANLLVINSNELIVIYDRNAQGQVERKLVKGPTLHLPTPSEYLHSFSWKGSNAFHKLQLTPQSMEVTVEFVRTADDGLLDINLLLYFQLVDVDKLIDNTSCPITDLTNSVASDLVLAITKTTFETFSNNTEMLHSLKTYKQATAQASRIGFEILKIVFKGYSAGEALQKMQDERIQARTKLATQEESEKLNQKMLDFKLSKERERAEQAQQLQFATAEAQLKIRQLQLDQSLLEQQEALQLEKRAREEQLRQEFEFLQSIKKVDAGMDFTGYLIAKYSQPARASESVSGELKALPAPSAIPAAPSIITSPLLEAKPRRANKKQTEDPIQ